MRSFCGVGFHAWNAFQYLYSVKVFAEGSDRYPVKELRVYERRCKSCGIPQVKKRRA